MFGLLGIVIGVLLCLTGIFLIFFFPASSLHQESEFTVTGIAIGIIFLILGVVLVFF